MEEGGVFPFPEDCEAKNKTIEGVPFPFPFIDEAKIKSIKTLQARPDDVFITSFPKAGMICDHLQKSSLIPLASCNYNL